MASAKYIGISKKVVKNHVKAFKEDYDQTINSLFL
tara:strand:- start:2261 stop:2365 length:105 start_codon:yes stop_codon:yes gene_type:complete